MLNPPNIDGKLPAQYGFNLYFKYEDNRGVAPNEYKKVRAKIKTISTDIILKELDSLSIEDTINNQRIAYFNWANSGLVLTTGQYYKVQLCYIEEDGTEGYYSTPGIFKKSAEPHASIEYNNLEVTGTLTIWDLTERVEQYKFDVLNNQDEIIETSGWLLHSVSDDTIETPILTSTDKYIIKTLQAGSKVRYSIITNNLLQATSTKNLDIDYVFTEDASIQLSLNYDNGYIKIIKDNATNLSLLRSIDGNSWKLLTQKFNKTFNDFTVEQGVTYYYAIGNNNDYNYNKITCDFEDMFLSDGIRQLKIPFNPKVNSFKNVIQETKKDTIGGAYPVFFRNGNLKYKEFQISGLISMLMDNNQMFIPSKQEYNDNQYRKATSSKDNNNVFEMNTQLTGSNIANERRFKLEVLEWLNNGKPKLFRSPTEGNYIVRLLNISLSPEDQLGRMLHTFSATAYEMKELNIENLQDMGFFSEGGSI